MYTQQEIDSMAESLRAQGLTWRQTHFAVSLVERETARLQAQVDALAVALVRAQKWIESQMLDKGWSEDRVKQPPEGSHLHAIALALAAAGR